MSPKLFTAAPQGIMKPQDSDEKRRFERILPPATCEWKNPLKSSLTTSYCTREKGHLTMKTWPTRGQKEIAASPEPSARETPNRPRPPALGIKGRQQGETNGNDSGVEADLTYKSLLKPSGRTHSPHSSTLLRSPSAARWAATSVQWHPVHEAHFKRDWIHTRRSNLSQPLDVAADYTRKFRLLLQLVGYVLLTRRQPDLPRTASHTQHVQSLRMAFIKRITP